MNIDMHRELTIERPSPRSFQTLLLASAVAVFLLILLGGMARVTGSGGACLDWPTCFGQFTPPGNENALIDYLHRFATLIATGLILAATVLAWKRCGKIAPPGCAVCVAGVIACRSPPAMVATKPRVADRSWLTALHLGLSLLALGLILVGVVLAYSHLPQTGRPARLVYRSPFARLSLWVLAITFLLLVSGALVSGSQSAQACTGWPFCQGMLLSADPALWINLVHRLITAVAMILLGWQFIKAWRTQRTQTATLVSVTAATVLFLSQALLGARLVEGYSIYLLGLHQATSVAVWASLVVSVACAGLAGRTREDERAEAFALVGRQHVWRDLLMLTKPIVVALLLVTTFAGMVIGAKAWPSLSLALWTLLGGFMAAGGSGAINQYIDRNDDLKMQRTQKRPIPSGRLTPGEGLAFGVGMALASFYLMVATVNFLAALLSLVGIIYYVLIYSILLKKTTVQNIVIGGGAGAIPPLVGWAAATGGLNIPSLFLFAVIFMWTPPHFWALALVRSKDYARAGVPMLPVVRGEKETRWQILLYTLELVALTLLLPLFGLGGSIYFVGAAALGGWLLLSAWKLWKQGGNKVAWKMYRYSSMYLAFIFVVLMVDALL
jgi:protoheme IX farnesyltransferase